MQTGLVALEIVARISKVDLDSRAVIREFGITGEEISEAELIRIARHHGFKARSKSIDLTKLTQHYPLPAILLLKDGSYAVLLRLDAEAEKAFWFTPPHQGGVSLPLAEIEKCWSGRAIILRHQDAVSDARFGLNWFFHEILRFKHVMAEMLLGSFVVQLFALATPLFIQVIIDKVLNHRSMATLDVLALAFLAILVFEFLLNISRKYIFVHTTGKIDARLGARLFKHLLSLPYVYFESRKVGNIAARVRELDTIREFIANKSVAVIIDLFFSFVFIAVMALYSVKLMFVVCGFVALIGLIYLLITPELRNRLESKFQMGAQSNSYLVESVTGIQTVKSLAIEGSMQQKWEDFLGRYIHARFRLSNMANFSNSLAHLLQRVMTLVVLYLGVKMVLEQQLTVGQLIAFQMLAGQFAGPVLRLVNLWNEFQQALLSVDRIGDILNRPQEYQPSSAITLPKVSGRLRFQHVSFRYHPDGPLVLRDISLAVEPGMKIGIVGKSGSGKSTLAKLIQRLYVASEGAIFFDNIDVRHLNPLWLRHHIGVVLQESFLFSGTIRENIAMPRPDAGMDLIIQAAELAGAHEFITQMADGYDTYVGERGTTLSGGQKQRIAIARALITEPRLLVFDEATSALDFESEMIIRKSLHRIRKGRTMLIISHKLSIVEDCDLIITLQDGELAEAGTHGHLLRQGGLYQRLYNTQKN